MIGTNYYYKGTKLPITVEEANLQGWAASPVIRPINVQNSEIPRDDGHGTTSNPTLARGRLIPIEGSIFSMVRTERGISRNTVDTLFSLESFPAQGEGFYPLKMLDDDGSEWELQAKVYSPPRYDGDILPVIDFSAELFAEDGFFRSTTETSASGIIGMYGGMTLSTTLPEAMDSAVNQFELVNAGTSYAPVVVTITGEIRNPKIRNITTGRYFQVERTLTLGETLVIDSEKEEIRINDSIQNYRRMPGSTFLGANAGSNFFVLEDADGYDPDNDDDAQATVSFYARKQ